jgi:hypothetical protein
MSAIKDYLYDLQEYVIQAIENGYTSVDEVYAAVNTNMVASKDDVRAILEKFQGEPEFPELNGVDLNGSD